MRFVWDDEKNRQNLAKHGVSFELAALVFEDSLAVSVPDPFEDEDRWQTIGLVKGVLALLVVHTQQQEEDDEEKIRIISARKATRRERKKYEETQYEN